MLWITADGKNDYNKAYQIVISLFSGNIELTQNSIIVKGASEGIVKQICEKIFDAEFEKAIHVQESE